jgi:nicotinate-nucleotide adenylyltransferase
MNTVASDPPSARNPRRIGLYGGTFDPVHNGHLMVARAALEELSLDRLIFLPAARSPFKEASPPSAPEKRLRWLRMALAGWSGCEVDDLEIRRGGLSYTVETVRTFRERNPEATLFWLIGSDQLEELHLWKDAGSLVQWTDFAVIPRPDHPVRAPRIQARWQPIVGWPCRISSSDIRERLKAGRRLDHLVPPCVAEALAQR